MLVLSNQAKLNLLGRTATCISLTKYVYDKIILIGFHRSPCKCFLRRFKQSKVQPSTTD